MLAKITVLTSLGFAVVYPLTFWISAHDPLKNKFHKFHLGLPNIVGGVTLVFILFMDIPIHLKGLACLWKASFLGVSRFYWKKETPNVYILSAATAIGLIAFIKLQTYLISPALPVQIASLLAALIYCASLYAMNLGHWYLNVHGLPLSHLRNATYVFWALLGVRLVWDIFQLTTNSLMYRGEVVSLYTFSLTLDGFLLLVAIFFGTLFPFGALFFARETIKLKNTNSTTGILYVILCGVLLGDIAYKYYLIRYGIAL